jgi:hypothetical protein
VTINTALLTLIAHHKTVILGHAHIALIMLLISQTFAMEWHVLFTPIALEDIVLIRYVQHATEVGILRYVMEGIALRTPSAYQIHATMDTVVLVLKVAHHITLINSALENHVMNRCLLMEQTNVQEVVIKENAIKVVI